MRRALAGGAVTVLALAGGAAAVSEPSVRLAAPAYSGVATTTIAGYGERGTTVVDYQHGAVLRLSLPVTNTGRVPVTVTGASLGQGPIALLTVRSVAATRVPAGETRTVAVEAVLGNCRWFHERETQSYDGIALDLSVLGRSAGRTLTFTSPLLVHSPMIVGCPDRKLNRQADDRSKA